MAISSRPIERDPKSLNDGDIVVKHDDWHRVYVAHKGELVQLGNVVWTRYTEVVNETPYITVKLLVDGYVK